MIVPTPVIVTASPASNTGIELLLSTIPSTIKPLSEIAPSPDVNPASMTLPLIGVSSGVLTASLPSVNTSSTGTMVRVNVDVSVPPLPSDNV